MNLWVAVGLSLLCSVGFSQKDSNPDVVKIGAIFSFNTINGRVSKIGMNAAVEEINSDPTILKGKKLVLSTHDSNTSGFLGIIGGIYVCMCVCVGMFMFVLEYACLSLCEFRMNNIFVSC